MAFQIFVLLSLFSFVFAANDWSKPCLSGVCFYDLPTSDNGASGTLKVWGSANAITDITTAAGWEIIECNKDALSQDIRLVCNGDAKCNHLYENIGAVGKIVRLPENCGANPFAHISRAWVPENQTIPVQISRRLVRRDGVEPEVKALHIDTDFANADVSKVGEVNFALTGANYPGAKDIINEQTVFETVVTEEVPEKRGFFSKLKKAVKKVGKGIVGGVKKVGKVVKTVAKKAINFVKDLNTVEIDESKTLPAFNVDKNFNLVNEQVSCPPLEGRLKLDVNAKANGVATVGVAAEGTIIPPRVKDFAVTATLTGEIDGTISLEAGLTGTLDSGKVKLVEVGIPGFSFPGILTIGPSLEVNARANAALDINANLVVGLNYKFEGATLVFPSNDKSSGFKLGDTPLKLTASPSVKATGLVEAHLIPSLNLGISALAGVAEAKVFVELDASAKMSLEFEASGEGTITIGNAPEQQQPPVIEAQPDAGAASNDGDNTALPPADGDNTALPPTDGDNTALPPSDGDNTALPPSDGDNTALPPTDGDNTALPPNDGDNTALPPADGDNTAIPPASVGRNRDGIISNIPRREIDIRGSRPIGYDYFVTRQLKADKTFTSTFGGCFEISAGLAVNAGADASFFGLFDLDKTFNLFEQDFQLFKKCFGDRAGSERRRSLGRLGYIEARSPVPSPVFVTHERRLLQCLLGGGESSAAPETLVDEVVVGADVKPF